MTQPVHKRIPQILASVRKRRMSLSALAAFSVLLAAAVFMSAVTVAAALTTPARVLDCHYAGNGAHTHNADCYDEDGNLVCPLTERELHTHDASCYDADGRLVCGKEEVTEEHVHGPACFREVTAISFVADHFSTYVMAVRKLQQTLVASDGRTYEISLTYTADAGIPDDAELVVREITENDSAFVTVFDRAKQAATAEHDQATVTNARFFDISLMKDGVVLEPLAPVEVNIVLTRGIDATEATSVVHFTHSTVEVLDADVAPITEETSARVAETASADSPGADISFTADSFSIYGIVELHIERDVMASDGHNYHIDVTYGSGTGVPANAELVVTEITPETDPTTYSSYLALIERSQGWEGGSTPYARLFDIKIVDKNGEKVSISSPVQVSIVLADKNLDDESTTTQLMHFADGAETPDIIEDAQLAGDTVSFAAEGFSVYAIVEAPDPNSFHTQTVEGIAEGQPYLLSITSAKNAKNTYYFKSSIINKLIARTTVNNASDAAEWYFEKGEEEGQFYLYFKDDSGAKNYVYVANPGNGAEIKYSTDNKTAFYVELYNNTNGGFFIYCKNPNNATAKYALNLFNSDGGVGFGLWNAANGSDAGSKVALTNPELLSFDPYGLDGKTYGIAYHNDTAAAAALMAEVKDATHLVATDMLMRTNALTNDGIVLVAADSDITDWTFHCESGDTYYITATVDGQTKYLTLEKNALTLENEKTDYSVFKVTLGSRETLGKYHFSVGSYYIEENLSGNNTSRGFFGTTSANNGTTWLNLVERSALKDDDFTLYSAQKVSVSDTEKVFNGQKVVIYTRVWNDTKKRYEFYAVDYDGSLVPCYDTGDNIEWTGTKINTAVWTFTEHLNASGSPSYFYDLENVIYGDALAPSVTLGNVLADGQVGINLNGRRYGESYTTIIAWDQDNYAYSGLKVENGYVVACPLAEADDFYFAIVNEKADDVLTEVATIDSNQYGISMKMVDYNNDILQQNGNKGDNANGRDSLQTSVLGYNTDKAGLLDTQINPKTGYPDTNPANTGQDAGSLATLYQGTTPVNHLFLESIYNESGYFEYDSTQNFAHLNADGTFTVYNQLGTITEHVTSGDHGQFLPYNDLTPGKYSKDVNKTNVLDQELADTDPRKNEKLYGLGNRKEIDYFFGMEIEASFTQTPSGLDAWGHDIIFEFSGDDDFWLYVDGELVLDLGGTHAAMTGTVNFRTGEVTRSLRTKNDSGPKVSTLYDTFKAHYEARGMSEDEVSAKLAELFTKNAEGNYVFSDYSNHTMKVYYMERGAGASNLHMRFNLAAVKPGTFTLSKQLSGTDSPANDLIEFPYQIWYTSKSDPSIPPAYRLLGEKTGDEYNVTYQGTTANVRFAESFTPADGSVAYENVFFLKPGQTAQVALPDDALNYYVVECGVNPDVYDKVAANGAALTGTETENKVGETARRDYAISPATLDARSQVDYVNHVAEGAMRTLDITKRLWDADGQTNLHYPTSDEDTTHIDRTTFSLRLYLGDENADPADLPAANLYQYYVKDPSGNYCRWNSAAQAFVSLGITDHGTLAAYLDGLSAAEREAIVFRTSMNGAITKIPADYTVEVRDLIVASHYKVEERDYEIPKGYTLRLDDGYTRVDGGREDKTGTTPYSGKIQVNESPEIEVRNQKGWGLTVEKVWTDKDFMANRNPIYLAVYVKALNDDTLSLLEGSVRQLAFGTDSVYYFFGNLKSDIPFANYVVREVTLSELSDDFSVDDKGVVTLGEGTQVTPLEGDNMTIDLDGRPVGGSDSTDKPYHYSVSYQPGEQTTQNENVRTDTVTNSRPGIKLYKTKWSYDEALPGAKFSLKDASGNDVAATTYTSDANGLITIAYLTEGTYTLSETSAPKGYEKLGCNVTFIVDENGSVRLEEGDSLKDLCQLTEATESEMATLKVRNRTVTLEAKKLDSVTGDAISGAHFALYKQVSDQEGNGFKDYQPLSGYEDLVTDDDGLLPGITMSLKAGTYYLVETQAAEGYDKLADDLVLTIGSDGTVSVGDFGTSWLTHTDKDGNVAYTLAIPNGKLKKVSFIKVDVANTDITLAGAQFDLYQVLDGTRASEALLTGLTSGKDGLLAKDKQTVFELAAGSYELVETKAPDGYNLKAQPVKITISSGLTDAGEKVEPGKEVSYDEGTTLSQGAGLSYDKEKGVYTLTLTNTAGFELPQSGGPGLATHVALATVLFSAAGLILVVKKIRLLLA